MDSNDLRRDIELFKSDIEKRREIATTTFKEQTLQACSSFFDALTVQATKHLENNDGESGVGLLSEGVVLLTRC